jgi:hypothetical protein
VFEDLAVSGELDFSQHGDKKVAAAGSPGADSINDKK